MVSKLCIESPLLFFLSLSRNEFKILESKHQIAFYSKIDTLAERVIDMLSYWKYEADRVTDMSPSLDLCCYLCLEKKKEKENWDHGSKTYHAWI